LAKKVGVKGAEKLAGASKAVILNFLRRMRSWHEHGQLAYSIEPTVRQHKTLPSYLAHGLWSALAANSGADFSA
jgi:hypothetical protein